MPTVTAIPYLFQKITSESIGHSGNTDSPSKVPDSGILEKQQQTQSFRFLLRVAKAFVPEHTEVTFGCTAHARKREIMQFTLRSALRMCERHVAEVSLKFPQSCKLNRSESRHHLETHFMYDRKHG